MHMSLVSMMFTRTASNCMSSVEVHGMAWLSDLILLQVPGIGACVRGRAVRLSCQEGQTFRKRGIYTCTACLPIQNSYH